MIFPGATPAESAQQARAAARGAKTQTRRLDTGKTTRYKPGHDYAVQLGKGGEAIGRVKVHAVRLEPVGQITHRDARCEGFRNTAHFKSSWVRRHDARWIETQEVTTDDAGTIDVDRYITDADLLARFERRHAHRLVWVITFEPLVDAPRFLSSQRDILTGHGDYTPNPRRSIDDLECIDELTQARYAERARKLAEEQRSSFRRDLEEERQRRKAASPRTISRADRGRQMRQAA
jgi:hypothetical protein